MKVNQDQLISVVIPTYRRPDKLQNAIRSVLRQTYPHLRVYVLDNASGDDTADLVQEFARMDTRVHYICHKKNIGALANFEFGLNMVDTPYFSFLSDDDLLLPYFYETAINKLHEDPRAMFCATNVFRIGSHDCILPMPLEHCHSGVHHPPEGLLSLIRLGRPEWTGTLFRAEIRSSVGSLDLETGKYCDVDYVLRIASSHSFIISKKPCAVFDGSQWDDREPYRFDGLWLGLQKMLRNIEASEELDEKTKQCVIQHYLRKFESSLLRLGLLYIYRGYLQDARKVVNLMYERKKVLKAVLLDALLRLVPILPGLSFVMKKLALFRRQITARKMRNMPKLPMSAWR